MIFSIEIVIYYCGRVQHKLRITPDAVCSEQNVAVRRSAYVKHQRALTPDERRRWTDFLSGFPLPRLGEAYIHPGVKDGKQMRFVIQIDDAVKEIHVANYYIRELGDLADRAAALLPEDYIQYNRSTVRTEIEA